MIRRNEGSTAEGGSRAERPTCQRDRGKGLKHRRADRTGCFAASAPSAVRPRGCPGLSHAIQNMSGLERGVGPSGANSGKEKRNAKSIFLNCLQTKNRRHATGDNG